MSEAAILTAARAAVSAALPGWRDWSDDPAAIKPDKMGAFAVTVTRNGATRAAMGSTAEEVALTVAADVFLEFGAYENGRQIATARGSEAAEAIKRDPDFRRLVDFVTGAASDVELASGEKRLARASVALSVLATF